METPITVSSRSTPAHTGTLSKTPPTISVWYVSTTAASCWPVAPPTSAGCRARRSRRCRWRPWTLLVRSWSSRWRGSARRWRGSTGGYSSVVRPPLLISPLLDFPVLLYDTFINNLEVKQSLMDQQVVRNMSSSILLDNIPLDNTPPL